MRDHEDETDMDALRDRFAERAMIALIPIEAGSTDSDYSAIPKAAYTLADAMLKERDNHLP